MLLALLPGPARGGDEIPALVHARLWDGSGLSRTRRWGFVAIGWPRRARPARSPSHPARVPETDCATRGARSDLGSDPGAVVVRGGHLRPGMRPVAMQNLVRFVLAGGVVALGTDLGGFPYRWDLDLPLTELPAGRRSRGPSSPASWRSPGGARRAAPPVLAVHRGTVPRGQREGFSQRSRERAPPRGCRVRAPGRGHVTRATGSPPLE